MLSYGFFNAEMTGPDQYDREYNAEQFAEYFSLFIANGVFPDPATQLQVVASTTPDMNVSVKEGYGWVNGYWAKNDSPYSLAVQTADGSLNRVDIVVLRWVNESRSFELAVKTGVPAASPVAPTLQRDAGVYELMLARITLAAGATQVTQAVITDTRPDNTVCGFVTGLIDQIDTTDLFAQYDAALAEKEEEFNEWFANLQGQLSGDVAANLQNQINQLSQSVAISEETKQSIGLPATATLDQVVKKTGDIGKYVTDQNGNILKLITDKTKIPMTPDVYYRPNSGSNFGDTYIVESKDYFAFPGALISDGKEGLIVIKKATKQYYGFIKKPEEFALNWVWSGFDLSNNYGVLVFADHPSNADRFTAFEVNLDTLSVTEQYIQHLINTNTSKLLKCVAQVDTHKYVIVCQRNWPGTSNQSAQYGAVVCLFNFIDNLATEIYNTGLSYTQSNREAAYSKRSGCVILFRENQNNIVTSILSLDISTKTTKDSVPTADLSSTAFRGVISIGDKDYFILTKSNSWMLYEVGSDGISTLLGSINPSAGSSPTIPIIVISGDSLFLVNTEKNKICKADLENFSNSVIYSLSGGTIVGQQHIQSNGSTYRRVITPAIVNGKKCVSSNAGLLDIDTGMAIGIIFCYWNSSTSSSSNSLYVYSPGIYFDIGVFIGVGNSTDFGSKVATLENRFIVGAMEVNI